MSQTETLQAALSEARASLVAALAEGADTAGPRQRIVDLEGQAADLERQAREERAEASRAEAAAVEQATAALAAETHAAVDSSASVPGLAELIGEPLPAVPVDPAIVAAAREVARCRAALERAAVELKPLAAQASMLAARLGEKRAAVEKIKARRVAGDERAADGADLLALTADAEALQLLAGDSSLKASAADTRPAARAALANAEAALAHHQRLSTLAAAKARAELAEDVLLEAAAVARAAEKAVGAIHPSMVYVVSSDLRKLVVGVR